MENRDNYERLVALIKDGKSIEAEKCIIKIEITGKESILYQIYSVAAPESFARLLKAQLEKWLVELIPLYLTAMMHSNGDSE